MSTRTDLLRRLERLRPADPAPERLSPAAVRILARVAVLEGVSPPSAARLRRRMAALLTPALVVACVLCVPASRSAGERPPGAGAVARPCPEPGGAALEAALLGQRLARLCLSRAGAQGREVLWQAAERGRGGALSLLRTWGRLLGDEEVRRAGRLVLSSAAQAEALDLLVAEPGAAGLAMLTTLLVAEAAVEEPVVAALRRVAQRGAREEALRALLAGAAAGRVRAAAAAVALGPSSVVDRLLVLLPPDRFGDPALGAALAAARPTLAARVLRRAEAGDALALTWAAGARLEGAVPVLQGEAAGEGRETAARAVERLAAIGGVGAWLALARSTAAPHGALARERLAGLEPSERERLVERALASGRDRPAALWALACAGPEGVDALLLLARRPAFLPEVLAALERSPVPAAAQALRRQAEASDSPLPALAALGRRLAAGHADAGPALLALALEGPRRAALEALLGAGEPGAALLDAACTQGELAPDVRALLARGASRPRAPATRPARAARSL